MPMISRCSYCTHTATTRDHVIPRCFLEKPYPPNLLTVPSCASCNGGYSIDEQYALVLMAKSGFVPTLLNKVAEGGAVDRALQRDSRLDDLFIQSAEVKEDGRVFLKPDIDRLGRVLRKVAFGLYCHRYRPASPPSLEEFALMGISHEQSSDNSIVVMAHTERFRPRRWRHVQAVAIDGRKFQVFDYMFVRNWVWSHFGSLVCLLRIHQTLWAAFRCPNPSSRRTKTRGRYAANSPWQLSLL
jgi:hypothetical protein